MSGALGDEVHPLGASVVRVHRSFDVAFEHEVIDDVADRLGDEGAATLVALRGSCSGVLAGLERVEGRLQDGRAVAGGAWDLGDRGDHVEDLLEGEIDPDLM